MRVGFIGLGTMGGPAAAIGEAMVAAKVAGLEPEAWWEAMKGGAADSYVMHHDVPAVFAGHYDPSFPIALCLKDLDLIAELMRETGVRNDLIKASHARFREAGERYGLDAGDMTVCKLLEDDAGVECASLAIGSRHGKCATPTTSPDWSSLFHH